MLIFYILLCISLFIIHSFNQYTSHMIGLLLHLLDSVCYISAQVASFRFCSVLFGFVCSGFVCSACVVLRRFGCVVSVLSFRFCLLSLRRFGCFLSACVVSVASFQLRPFGCVLLVLFAQFAPILSFVLLAL